MATSMDGEPVLVNIKFNNHTAFPLTVTASDTVVDVKQKISLKSDIDPSRIEIIFAGKVLQNTLQVQDLCLSQSSVLHVYQGRHRPTVEVICGASPSQTETNAVKYSYYVFCKTCGDLRPGKLRVRCQQCNEGSIILDRDPGSWSDVLIPGRIQGQCNSDCCQGNQSAQFYFKCAGHASDVVETAVPLQHIRPNSQQVECLTCGEVSVLVLVFPCQLRHVICLDCFKMYGLVSLNNRMFVQDPHIGYSLPCPAGCENSLVRESHHFCLLGKEQYERYKEFGAEQCLLQNGGLLCPRPGCGEGMFPSNDENTLTQCATCHYVFCSRCMRAYHKGHCDRRQNSGPHPETSEFGTDREEHARWEEESINTIDKTTKPCPGCKTRTEKFGGCMHMTCSRCKADWCWLCEKAWDRDCQGNHWFG